MPRIIINKKKCIGCGACVNVCNNFKLKDGKSYYKKISKTNCEKKAANACPVGAIKVIE